MYGHKRLLPGGLAEAQFGPTLCQQVYKRRVGRVTVPREKRALVPEFGP